jgi:ABC-2 type transport system ATP-binding protein
MELTIDRLTKQYKNKIAVDRFSIKLEPGVYGLLGSNGAGKTTLMRMICDIQKPTSGQIKYNGTDIKKLGEDYRQVLGYLPQDFGYYPDFTAYDFLMYIAALKGISKEKAEIRANELLQIVNLENEKKQKVKTFSGGMKQRLGIAQAMLNNPKILILDEPTAGLDPKERVKFRNLISSFSKDKIVILSTHIVSDIEFIADKIIVMKNGTRILTGTPEELLRNLRGSVWKCIAYNKKEVEMLNKKYCIINIHQEKDMTELRIVSETKPTQNAVNIEPNLEDLYLAYFQDIEK